MKKILVDINAIVQINGADDFVFEKAVISNLCRLEKMGYSLFITVDERIMNNKPVQKSIAILQRELQVEIIHSSKDVDGYDGCIEKNEKAFTLRQKGSTLTFDNWALMVDHIKNTARRIKHIRNTHETKIEIEINPDGSGVYQVDTGLDFFNHMLEQLSRHSLMDMNIKVAGDLHIDEHHTIEDTAIALGEALTKALGNKRSMERYGFLLPMDDCLAQAAIDFGGRPWLVWDADFRREYVGDMPTEMFYHFFKSFSDAAKCNLNIQATGNNEHHKIESIFKAFAKAIKMAVAVNENNSTLPTTKGVL
jgi:imidazoleglycerol-phosphate dehydratase/histidinol-phosphatase